MSLLPNILRLLLLLLTPLWLSLAAQGLGLRWSLPTVLSDWLHLEKTVDPATLPPPGWRESGYLAANPDVAAAVRDGRMSSGYTHYLQSGRAENRPGGFPTASAPVPAPPPAPVPAPPPVLPSPRTTASVEPPPASPAAAPLPKPRPDAQPDPALPPPRPVPSPVPEAAASPKPAATVPAAHVARIRTGNSDGAVRIILDLDRAPRFEPPVRRPDGSLAVTLPGTEWRATPSGRLPATEFTYRVESTGASSRLIVKGPKPLAPKAIAALPPDEERGHRLVIDAVAATPVQGKPARP
ncbi:hypothetical protein J2847_006272 [Azospirillum agricola]|uniref:hypothetical protein n=1 Tax=Azospirillum agricola TaxID=1720247 RepID=UPI001AE6363D|nr:hypothetical protein [Azospirillum agricola]MBP2232937.1 hypothetical protein [Azospirillum agricola]